MKNKNTSFKTKLVISFALLFLAVSFITRKPSADENKIHDIGVINNNISDTFLVGAMNDGLNRDYKLISDSLGLNLWHFYIGMGRRNDGSFDTKGWDWWNYIYPHSSNDSLTADSSYMQIVKSRLDSNELHNMKTIMHRPKIEYLCLGQRSDYQCEASHTNTDLWFYTFNVSKTGTYIQDITDNTYFGNGAKVKYCHGDATDAAVRKDTIVKRLKANNEQTDAGTNEPIGDKPFDWYVKPRIRIDSSFAANPLNDTVKVCKINVYNYYGDGNESNKILVSDSVIYVSNFRNSSNPYHGNYMEEFFFSTNPNDPPTSIKIDRPSNIVSSSGNKFNPDNKDWRKPRENRNDNPNDTAWCKVDFQVYWYGECDMYIDYIRVDNEIANRLFKTGGDIEYEDWIRWEIDLANHNDSPLKFYLELSDFNTIPCMSYVSKKLNSLTNNNVNLMTDFTWNRFFSHFQWPPPSTVMNAEYIIRNYIDSIGMTQFFAEYPYLSLGTSVLN